MRGAQIGRVQIKAIPGGPNDTVQDVQIVQMIGLDVPPRLLNHFRIGIHHETREVRRIDGLSDKDRKVAHIASDVCNGSHILGDRFPIRIAMEYFVNEQNGVQGLDPVIVFPSGKTPDNRHKFQGASDKKSDVENFRKGVQPTDRVHF